MAHHRKDTLVKSRAVRRRLALILLCPFLFAAALVGSVAANASAATTPGIDEADVAPAVDTANIWGSGFTPKSAVHVWVYRNHQQAAYTDTVVADADGYIHWYTGMNGYSTCHDTFDVQAYDVASNQLSANPTATLHCASPPTVNLAAEGGAPAILTVTGSGFSPGAHVRFYVYRNHMFVGTFEGDATSYRTISGQDQIAAGCWDEVDVVAYDFVSHQFSNNPTTRVQCIS